MKQFITSNSPETRVLFENFGLAVYFAQLLEGCLQSIVVAAELQGRIQFDRKRDLRAKDWDNELLHVCLNPMIQVLKNNQNQDDSEDFYKMMDKANEARNLLVHRFFLENATDLLNQAGIRSINDAIGRLYLTIRNALCAAQALRNAIYSEWGVTEERVQKHIENLKERYGGDEENIL
jgi:hypothetical protein